MRSFIQIARMVAAAPLLLTVLLLAWFALLILPASVRGAVVHAMFSLPAAPAKPSPQKGA